MTELDAHRMVMADIAFLNAQEAGGSTANAVRAAIRAYLKDDNRSLGVRTTYQVWVQLSDGGSHPFRMGMSLDGAWSVIARDHSGLNLFVVRETSTYEVVEGQHDQLLPPG